MAPCESLPLPCLPAQLPCPARAFRRSCQRRRCQSRSCHSKRERAGSRAILLSSRTRASRRSCAACIVHAARAELELVPEP